MTKTISISMAEGKIEKVPDAEDFMAGILKTAMKNLEQDGHLDPTLFVIFSERIQIMDLSECMQTEETAMITLDAIRTYVREKKPLFLLMLAEGWFKYTEDENTALLYSQGVIRVQDAHDRMSGLSFHLESPGLLRNRSWPILKCPDQKKRLGEEIQLPIETTFDFSFYEENASKGAPV